LQRLKRGSSNSSDNKENSKAAIHLAIGRETISKVDPKELLNNIAEILEQAEGQYKEWPMVG